MNLINNGFEVEWVYIKFRIPVIFKFNIDDHICVTGVCIKISNVICCVTAIIPEDVFIVADS